MWKFGVHKVNAPRPWGQQCPIFVTDLILLMKGKDKAKTGILQSALGTLSFELR